MFVFPSDRAAWRDARVNTRLFRVVRVTKAGGFTVPNLAPGDYLVAAVDDAVSGDWPDERFLQKAGAARDDHSPGTRGAPDARAASRGDQMTGALRTSAVITRAMTVVLLQTAVLAACMGGRLVAQAREAAVRPPATAMVSGVVVGDDTRSAPIRRALLTLSGGTIGPVQVVTDDAGRFTFEAVAAGTYTLTAEKPGYVKTFYGSRRPGRGPGMPIAVTDSQRPTDLTVRLIRGGVIAGTVFDHNGRPAASTQVTALQPQIVNGERRLVAPPASMPWVTTDDRGRYRFFGLPPGEYTVRSSGGTIGGDVRLVTPANLAAAARPPSTGDAAWSEPPQIRQAAAFHPASADASGAVFFTLAQGEERAGIDIRLRARADRED